MGRICSPQQLEKQRAKIERARLKTGAPHVMEYFHQVDDGYSHLAAQVLQKLSQRYDIELVCHLLRGHQGDNCPVPVIAANAPLAVRGTKFVLR